jgi:hypothetical protein
MLTMVFIGADRGAWEYYTNSVAMESGGERITSKASYYMENGTPAGLWAGTGLAGVGLEAGAAVDQQQLRALFGEGVHPLTGAVLGCH